MPGVIGTGSENKESQGRTTWEIGNTGKYLGVLRSSRDYPEVLSKDKNLKGQIISEAHYSFHSSTP